MNDKLPFGAIPSEPDYRDVYATASAVAALQTIQLPASYRTQLGPVQMQGKIPACVSHSIVDLMKLYWFKKTGKWIDFSPRFLDILSSETWIPLDGGRVPRTVMKLAASVGCCTTALLPNDVNGLTLAEYRDKNAITQAMKDEALKYKIPGFIYVSLEKTRESIFLYGAITSLFMVGEEMYVPSWNPVDTDPLRTPKKIQSGHQMTPIGWPDGTYNHLRNEWSEAWGNKGETKYNPALWSAYMNEQWAIAVIPEDVTTFLKSLPSPSDFHYQWTKNMAMGQVINDDVKYLQIALMILGFLGPVPADQLGYYGLKTRAAVGLFQKSQHIIPQAPESVGPKTRAALNTIFAL